MTDEDPRSFAALLKQRRRHLGLSQVEAAEKIGADEKSWRRWEAGQVSPSRHFATRIRELFQIDATRERDGLLDELGELATRLTEMQGELAVEARADLSLVLEREGGVKMIANFYLFNIAPEEALEAIAESAPKSGWTVHIAP